MPRTRDRGRTKAPSPAPASEPEEEEEEQEPMDTDGQPLQFDKPLIWRAGRPIAVGELLRRLSALYEEIRDVEQESAHRETLIPKAQELASPLLLGHKDKGVKAYTMLGIVEMFRLLAPDAPYKGGQLKEIFNLFVSTIVPALANPSDPYNTEHHNILVSLTKVKSIILLTDIPGSDNLILSLFSNCFDVLSGSLKGSAAGAEQVGKNVEFHMTGMLCTLVDESDSLPSEVTEIIVTQFLRADPNALSKGKKGEAQTPNSQVMREVSSAYNMARSICNSCAERMVRYIGQYFSAVLIDASHGTGTGRIHKARGKKRTYDESESESDDGINAGPSEDSLQEAERAHRLLRDLWRSCPDTIRNVVPQIEAEVGAENVQLRVMAVQTIGDMIAGVGAAGPPPPNLLDPVAYPSQSIEIRTSSAPHDNILLIPDAPHAFSSVYPSTYASFMDRHRDKAAQVRSAWVIEAGRIISTNGGGKGLDSDQETSLLRYLSDMLVDQDEKVRLAAVHAIARFDYETIIQKLGSNGSISTPKSVLCNLTERMKDMKHQVRLAAMQLLARIWGVAVGAITEGSERIRELLGLVPSRIFDTVYVNDRAINALVLDVLFDSLLPVKYPPVKGKASAGLNDSQRVADSQNTTERSLEPDRLRVERILTLVRDLDERARAVFFSWQQQQVSKAKYLKVILQHSDTIEAGEEGVEEARKQRESLIKILANTFPDAALATDHINKFIKHDRRNFALIRFCILPETDYRIVRNALKELFKRIEDSPGNLASILDTIIPLMHSASFLVCNRNHVPAMLEISRSDEKGLGSAAHDVIKEISSKVPTVFKVHIKELCESLRSQAPSISKQNDAMAVDSLKACSGFAQRFPQDIPKDRDFYRAMTQFAMYGMPPDAAKHAVTVIVASADKKESYIKEIIKHSTKKFNLASQDALCKLAAISQLRLLAYDETHEYDDTIMEITVGQVLSHNQALSSENSPEWTDDIDDLLNAKLWALKILVNGLRGRVKDGPDQEPSEQVRTASEPVFKLLNTLIEHEGEMSKTTPTPNHHKSRLRLAAAKQILKLCCNRTFDRLFRAQDFNRLTNIAQDAQSEVRAGFVNALKKYLGQGRLPHRFYSLVFLYAFEPTRETKDSTVTWLKARAASFAKRNETVMEAVFARFISLLVHHQDFSPAPEDLEDFVEYIMFYLKAVATQTNLPQIYNVAQRLKTVQDGIDPRKSENLYILSDLAEATIRQFQELNGWSLQILAGKSKLPLSIFAQLPSHAEAQKIAAKRFIPEELVDMLEDLVKNSMRTKKRKAENGQSHASKKPRTSRSSIHKPKSARQTPKSVKTPKPVKRKEEVSTTDRRKSSRNHNAKSYAENDDSEDDDELETWQSTKRANGGEVEEDEDDDQNGQADAENEEIAENSSTPPTSESTPAPQPPPEEEVQEEEGEEEAPTPSTKRRKQQRTRPPAPSSPSTAPAAKPKPKQKTLPVRATRRNAARESKKKPNQKSRAVVVTLSSDQGSETDLSDLPDGV